MRVKTNRTSFSYAEIIADITNGTKTSEVMTSTQPLVPLGSMVSLSSATIYQRNPDRNYNFGNIGSTKIYSICSLHVLLECATYKWKVNNGKIEIISSTFCICSSIYKNIRGSISPRL